MRRLLGSCRRSCTWKMTSKPWDENAALVAVLLDRAFHSRRQIKTGPCTAGASRQYQIYRAQLGSWDKVVKRERVGRLWLIIICIYISFVWETGRAFCDETGLNQIFQTTYDFLAGSVQQTISSASACTADTRAIEDRDDIYHQEERHSGGERKGNKRRSHLK